jgi:hypothetical protein
MVKQPKNADPLDFQRVSRSGSEVAAVTASYTTTPTFRVRLHSPALSKSAAKKHETNKTIISAHRSDGFLIAVLSIAQGQLTCDKRVSSAVGLSARALGESKAVY